LFIPFLEENDQTRARREHLAALHHLVGNVYPNRYERSQIVESGKEDTISSVVEKFQSFAPQISEGRRPATEEIDLANQQLNSIRVRVAGRIASPPRVMGKAAFVHLSDGAARLQVYVRQADVAGVRNDSRGGDVDGWQLFQLLDHGDFIGVEGYLFITRTGELSVHVQKLQFLAKALLPLPDKMHGINDPEIRQRQRYADLLAGSLKLEREEAELTPREVFQRRAKIVRELRRILEDHDYLEVETPMLTPLATGAAARPFKTYHNALDIDLYARIAPELYLKRLLVGGFEKVYELNRNFRNEGISTRHNPEFTMLEFYWAYADVNQMMDFCEEMLRATVFKVLGHTHVRFGRHDLDFSQPFRRLTMKQAISKYWSQELGQSADITLDPRRLEDPGEVVFLANWFSEWTSAIHPEVSDAEGRGEVGRQQLMQLTAFRERAKNFNAHKVPSRADDTQLALQIAYLFEMTAERHLTQPTFVTDFPKSISPLSKASPVDPTVAERFELFIAGMECANGFSELNDPQEQYERFREQMQQREVGDEEAMLMDEDYIRALSYGMPPAAGIGIGIDRFVMLLTNRQSIRDVILFPHMRPERKREEPLQPGDKEG